MAYSFDEIRARITDDEFQKECRSVAEQNQYVTYKVFAKGDDGVRKPAPRICNTDPNGILYIGRGSVNRLDHLASSVKKVKEDHHFGLKYVQLFEDITKDYSPLRNLYVEICGFGSDEGARECERKEQMDYRKKFGENPPYSGRWEGV